MSAKTSNPVGRTSQSKILLVLLVTPTHTSFCECATNKAYINHLASNIIETFHSISKHNVRNLKNIFIIKLKAKITGNISWRFVKLLLTLSKVMIGEKHKAQVYKATKGSSSRGENYSYCSCVKQIQWYRGPVSI